MKKLLCVWGASNYGKTRAIIEFDKILNTDFKGSIDPAMHLENHLMIYVEYTPLNIISRPIP